MERSEAMELAAAQNTKEELSNVSITVFIDDFPISPFSSSFLTRVTGMLLGTVHPSQSVSL
jgi:hypothetical protein